VTKINKMKWTICKAST